MGQEATVRVRLDTSGARSDLAALYGDFRRAPPIQVATGGGAGVGVAGGGVGGGGFSLGGMLGSIGRMGPIGMAAGIAGGMIAAPILGDAMGIANGVFGSVGQGISNFLGLNTLNAGIQGRGQAIQETASMFGLARGLGLVGEKESTSFYETIRPFREAAATGAAEIKGELSWAQAGQTLEDVGDRIVKAVEGLGAALGKGR